MDQRKRPSVTDQQKRTIYYRPEKEAICNGPAEKTIYYGPEKEAICYGPAEKTIYYGPEKEAIYYGPAKKDYILWTRERGHLLWTNDKFTKVYRDTNKVQLGVCNSTYY